MNLSRDSIALIVVRGIALYLLAQSVVALQLSAVQSGPDWVSGLSSDWLEEAGRVSILLAGIAVAILLLVFGESVARVLAAPPRFERQLGLAADDARDLVYAAIGCLLLASAIPLLAREVAYYIVGDWVRFGEWARLTAQVLVGGVLMARPRRLASTTSRLISRLRRGRDPNDP